MKILERCGIVTQRPGVLEEDRSSTPQNTAPFRRIFRVFPNARIRISPISFSFWKLLNELVPICLGFFLPGFSPRWCS